MNEADRAKSIEENLHIVSDFVEGDDYLFMCSNDNDAPEIKTWIEEFNLHYASFKFFFDLDPTSSRTHLESSVLAEKICNYLNYE